MYISNDLEIQPRLRLRQKGDIYEVTKKIPINLSDPSSHSEITIPLSKAEYQAVSDGNIRRVEK